MRIPRLLNRSAVGLATLTIAFALGACSEANAPTPTATATATSIASPTTEATPAPTSEPTASATVDPNAVVLSWTRSGGIAGFCDGLQLTAGHRAILGSCEDTPTDSPDGELAPTEAILEFEAWRDDLASFEVEWDDGDAVADGLTIRLSFVGRGTATADEETQRAIAEFAASLHTVLQASNPQVGTGSPEPAGETG